MSIFHVDEKLNICVEDGIWLDYRDFCWIVFIKDEFWDREELYRIRKGDVTFSFIQKGIVDAFLLEIFDCLETSDIPFCIKDADNVLTDSFSRENDYSFVICALDEENIVKAEREIAFTKQNSSVLKKQLKKRMTEDYCSEDFDKAYRVLLQRYEPYELEQYKLFTQKSRG